ncbi:MAG: hypothetical protein Q9198_004062 [Flavoplaca austrocitrina]
MSAQTDEQISNICDELRALQSNIAALPRTPDRSATHAINKLFCRGEGVLAKLQQPAGFQGKRTKQRSNEDGHSSSEAGDCSDDQDFDLDPQAKPDQDVLDDPSNKGRLGVNNALEFLKGLETEIATRQQLPPVAPPASLHANIKPFAHQLRATALCLHAEDTPFKGMIYADLPGLGKTLALLMTFSIGRKRGDGPSLVVVPASCGRQWIEEIRVQFQEGKVRALLLNDNSISPSDLYRYDVIVTSYNYVVSEAARLAKFDRQMEEYEQYKTSLAPKRPKVTLLSGIWKMDGVQHIGRYLGLDEAHAIKNYSGRSYAAIKQLRESFAVCLPTTGTPLDNTWEDVFALLSLLRGHPFTSMLRMREVFTDPPSKGHQQKKRLGVPKREKVARLVRLLHACTLSRPSTTVTKNLPPLHEQVVQFELPKEEREQSNVAFDEYKRTLGASYDDAAYGKGGDGERRRVKWSAMIKATQLAFHPTIPRIMQLVRKTIKQNMAADMGLEDVQLSEEEQAEYDGWRAMIQVGDNCRSARVDVIVDIVNQTRDRHPGDAILILDESTFFLDILEVACSRMYEPVDTYRYDGGQDPAERHRTLQKFSTAIGTRVMLATRATGGEGLNVQCANVVIRCGPWWKISWENQALSRSYRPGQTKHVWLYEISAKGCKVETYKRRVRARKNAVNASIMELVTMEDGQQPPEWNEL